MEEGEAPDHQYSRQSKCGGEHFKEENTSHKDERKEKLFRIGRNSKRKTATVHCGVYIYMYIYISQEYNMEYQQPIYLHYSLKKSRDINLFIPIGYNSWHMTDADHAHYDGRNSVWIMSKRQNWHINQQIKLQYGDLAHELLLGLALTGNSLFIQNNCKPQSLKKGGLTKYPVIAWREHNPQRTTPPYRTEAVLDGSQLSKRHLVMWQFCLFTPTGFRSWRQLLTMLTVLTSNDITPGYYLHHIEVADQDSVYYLSGISM